MRSRLARALLLLWALHVAANVAMAFSLPGPFSFSFFNPALNSWFLFPFTLAGCG